MRTLCCLVVVYGIALSTAAWAESDLARINALNQEATAALESYRFTKAHRRLHQAVDIAIQEAALQHAKLAETYVLLGVSAVAGQGDLYRGLHHFVRALRLDATSALPAKLATPQLVELLETARRTVKTVGQPRRIDIRKESPARARPDKRVATAAGRGLVHAPLDTARRGQPMPIKATAGLDVQAHAVHVHYRPAGTVTFTRLAMKREKGVWRAAIPADAARGRYVHYYIEALNQRGRSAGSNGTARSPNVVIIKK